MIKPVYGFLSDAVPIYGYRRCSYLAICGLLGGRQAAGSWQRGIPLPLLARRGCMLARLHARAAAPASDVPHAGAQHACSSVGAVPSMLIPPPPPSGPCCRVHGMVPHGHRGRLPRLCGGPSAHGQCRHRLRRCGCRLRCGGAGTAIGWRAGGPPVWVLPWEGSSWSGQLRKRPGCSWL